MLGHVEIGTQASKLGSAKCSDDVQEA